MHYAPFMFVVVVAVVLWLILFAVRVVEPKPRLSLDCRDGKHEACDSCQDCECHEGARGWAR